MIATADSMLDQNVSVKNVQRIENFSFTPREQHIDSPQILKNVFHFVIVRVRAYSPYS